MSRSHRWRGRMCIFVTPLLDQSLKHNQICGVGVVVCPCWWLFTLSSSSYFLRWMEYKNGIDLFMISLIQGLNSIIALCNHLETNVTLASPTVLSSIFRADWLLVDKCHVVKLAETCSMFSVATHPLCLLADNLLFLFKSFLSAMACVQIRMCI